jgi:hypothetical protein
MTIFACLISFVLGAVFGVGMVALAIAAGRRDGRK